MKGDFSRIRFNPSRHYTSVLQQQGRVSLDADANEQAAIHGYIRETQTRDVIGCYGGPKGDEGFAISVQQDAILIGAGRYYVRGILCQNEQPLDYASQPFLVDPGQTDAQLLGDLRGGAVDAVAVYLEVWQRLVTALDDVCLREPALGQADTTGRVQTVWRVVAESQGTSSSEQTHVTTGAATSVAADLGAASAASVQRSSARVVEDLSRVTRGAAFVNPNPFGPGPIRPGPLPGPFQPGRLPEATCAEMYKAVAAGDQGVPGRLSAHTNEGSGDCSCQPTPSAGFRGLENQLYRVEVHQGGDETTATFKWSRENGSVVAAVTGVSGANVQVDSLGPDANLGFAPGQWVELTDDSYQFGQPPNQPGELYQIQSTAPEQLSVTMSQSVVAVDPAKQARLRRWDQSGASALSGGVPLSAGSWLDLENGIQVQFTQGQYQSGDYWVVPARTASGQIDWPPCDSDGAAFQPAHRTRVFRAPLASLTWDATNECISVADCRRAFVPLTDLGAPTTDALHVSGINWVNDDVMALDALITNGLQVTLDQAAVGHVDRANFTVSLEVAVPDKGEQRGESPGNLPPVILRRPMIIDGNVSVQGTAILWQISADYGKLEDINDALLPGAQLLQWARARVRLLGRTVFAGSPGNLTYLDGQTYGTPGVRADRVTPRIDLQFPSGNLEKASDFESWFYLAPVLGIAAFTVAPASASIVPTPTGTAIVAAAPWAANTAYNAGDHVVDPNYRVQSCTVAGTSGGSTPKWAGSVGATTQDGGVTWQVVQPTAVVPQGTVTLGYPASADTTITLSISGPSGTARAISVPPTVVVPANQTTQTFAITVQANPFTTQDYTIIASTPPAPTLGADTEAADFGLTGWVEIN